MMDELYILQVTREIGFGGGSESVAYELHRAWLSLGIDARAITSLATEPEAREGLTFAMPWLAFFDPRSRWRYLATLIAVPLFTLAATWRVLRSSGPRVVVSHGDSLVGDVCVVHAVNRASLAAKWRAGYFRWCLNPSNLWVTWRDWWMLRGGRYRRIVAISDSVRRQLKTYYQVPDERIAIIPNGINLSRYQPANVAFRASVRREFGIAEDAPLVLFVGNQYHLKGLEVAIRSLGRMETNATLLVVGGDTATPFKHLADELGLRERVIFAGARIDLPHIYPAADALVLPTLYETFALVCIEAMASGLPVLACPVGGIEDYLIDGENGFHITRNPSDIAAKLDLLLNDPQLSARIRERGLSTAGEYAWERIAAQYLNLFEEVVAEREHEICPA